MIDGKNTVVVFTRSNARIYVNPGSKEIAELLTNGQAVLNPDLSLVGGFPPHFWKVEYGRIVPMKAEEQEKRLEFIAKHGVDNTIITREVLANDPVPHAQSIIAGLELELQTLRAGIKPKEDALKQKYIFEKAEMVKESMDIVGGFKAQLATVHSISETRRKMAIALAITNLILGTLVLWLAFKQ